MRKPQGNNSTEPLFVGESFDDVDNSLGNLKSHRAIQSILVVDPDPGFSSTVSDYLKLFGYNICYRTEIDEALEYAVVNNSDVIFLADNFDFHHPIDVLRKFKHVIPEALIAILANKGDDQLAVELLKAGADDYLSRRVKDKDILTSIASLLEQLGRVGKNSIESRGGRKEDDYHLEAKTLSNNQDSGILHESFKNSPINSKELAKKEIETLQFDQISDSTKIISEDSASQFLNGNVLEKMPGMMMGFNRQLEIISCNANCANFFGFEQSNFIGQTAKSIIPKQFYVDFENQVEQVIGHSKNENSSSNSSLFEMVIMNANNVGIPVRCELTPIQGNLAKEEVNYILAMEDLSQEKARQAELLYHSMWSNLLRAFAHRFINLKLEKFSQELSSMVAETANFFKLDRVSIYLFDKNHSRAKIYLEWLKKDTESLKIFSKKIDVEANLAEFKRLLSGENLLLTPVSTVKDPDNEECGGLSEHYAQVDSSSTLVFPIRTGKNIIGWIALDHQDSQNQWQQSDRELLEPLGLLISEGFTRRSKEEQRKVTHQKLSENHGHLSEQAFLDGLTNLANRRYFDKVLESEVRRASRDKTNIAVLFCDVDFFKAFNDTYGHLEGDICLKAIAAILKQEFQRAGDFVARFGGEEFAVVLSGTLANDAQTAAEKLRSQVESMNIPHSGSPLGNVTISIGISSVVEPQPNDSKKLLSKADKALYKAKSKGRNRVEVARFSPR